MLKRALYTAGAVVALGIGLLGLLIPVIPGVLFVLLAAVLFAGASRRFRARLHASPRVQPYLRRWEQSAGLPGLTRARIAGLLIYACATDSLRVTSRRG